MTRNSDLDCQDLFGCLHKPEIPIVDEQGNIVEWRCRCGRSTAPVTKATAEPSDEPYCDTCTWPKRLCICPRPEVA